jgi:prepilin peptidase CpaA
VDYGVAILLLFAVFATYGAYSDIRFRTIPNALNATMALAGLGAIWFSQGGIASAYALAHLAVALAAGLLLYGFGMWGGGDAKFYAASAAWFQLWDFPRLAVSIAMAGLVLLIVWFGTRQIRGSPKLDRKSKELPYGVAIAIGGTGTLALGLLR